MDRTQKIKSLPLAGSKKSWWKFWEMYQDKESEIVEDNERMDIIGQNGNDGLHYDVEEPNEPREENDPAPLKVKPPTAKGGVRIK